MSGISRLGGQCSTQSSRKVSSLGSGLRSLPLARTGPITCISPSLLVASRTQSSRQLHSIRSSLTNCRILIKPPTIMSQVRFYSSEHENRTLKLSLPETFSTEVPQYTPYGHKTPQPWTSVTNLVRNFDYFTTRFFGKRHSEQALSALIRDVESYKESKAVTEKIHPEGQDSEGFQHLDRKHQLGEYFSNEFLTGSVDALGQLITAVRNKDKSLLSQMCTEELYSQLDEELVDFDPELIKSITIIPDATRSMIREVHTFSGSQPVCEHFMHNAYINEKQEGLLRFGNYFVESKAKDELPEGAQFVIDVEVDAMLDVELNDGSTGVIEKTFVISFQSSYLPREVNNLANDNLALISIVDYSVDDFDWTISNINYSVNSLVEHDEPTPDHFSYDKRIEWEGRTPHPPTAAEDIKNRINRVVEPTEGPVDKNNISRTIANMDPYFGLSTHQRDLINEGLDRVASQLPELPKSSTVVILGGGISGLTSAYFLSESRPDLKIRVLESQDRFGGWVESKIAQTAHGSTIFEKGPRTLKYNVGADILLNAAIKFDPELRVAKVRSMDPVNVPRVLYDGKLQLVPSPALGLKGILQFLISPLGLSILPQALGRYLQSAKYARPEGVMDETMKQFFDRRIGPAMSSGVGSALAHGIYAGDWSQISASATFGAKYDMERIMGLKVRHLSMHDVLLAYIFARGEKNVMDPKLTHGGTAMYVLPDGLESIVDAYVGELKRRPNVSLESNTKVAALSLNDSRDGCLVSVLGQQEPIEAQLVHSTLTTQKLAPLLAKPVRKLVDVIPTTTLMVINIYIPERDVTGIKGFGYLVPNQDSPATSNPDSILGVIFDSDVGDAAEPVSGRKVIPYQADKSGTKLTVMMGGHYWNGISQYPTEDEAIARAHRAVYKHLGINLSDYECTFDARLQRDSIPQPGASHYETTEDIKELLYEAYAGRLSLDGGMALGGGVGISECIVDSYLLGATYDDKVPQNEVKNLKNMRYRSRMFSYPVD